jgi:outer membrane immunogenic protein
LRDERRLWHRQRRMVKSEIIFLEPACRGVLFVAQTPQSLAKDGSHVLNCLSHRAIQLKSASVVWGPMWENNMKKLAALLAVSTVLTFGAAAKAADIVEAPPEVYDWTGIYVGGNIGYAFEGNGNRVGLQSNQTGCCGSFGELNVQGIFGGGQIGADWQAGWAVFGLVADVAFADINDDFNNHSNNSFPTVSTDAKDEIDWWGTVRGRLGWAFDRVLVYGTGGFAWANVDYKVFTTDGVLSARVEDDYTATGWTAGGGLAYAIDENWSAGGEVLYVNLGEEEIDGRVRNAAGNATGEKLKTHATPDFWAAKFILNFKF